MSSESCPSAPTTLNEICQNVIGVDPWWSGFIKQEEFSKPGGRVQMDALREMMTAAFNLGQMTRSGSSRDVIVEGGLP